MKNRKTFLMVLISILYFWIIVQGLNTFSNKQNDKDNKNIVPLSSVAYLVAIEWNRTWGGSGHDGSSGVAADSSDNVYFVGHTRSFGAGDRDMVLLESGDMVLGENRGEDLAISGYDLLLFICVIGVITTISLNKKYKK